MRHTVQVLGSEQVADLQECPVALPSVAPQVQAFGAVQVAGFQVCPLAVPSVAPQEQVFGAVQVAALKLWTCGGSVVGLEAGSVV